MALTMSRRGRCSKTSRQNTYLNLSPFSSSSEETRTRVVEGGEVRLSLFEEVRRRLVAEHLRAREPIGEQLGEFPTPTTEVQNFSAECSLSACSTEGAMLQSCPCT
jgi:hypothetical protein